MAAAIAAAYFELHVADEVPDANRAVVARAGQAAVARRERQTSHRPHVAGHRANHFRAEVNRADGAVVASTGDVLAGRIRRDRAKGLARERVLLQLLSACQRPDAECAVRADRHETVHAKKRDAVRRTAMRHELLRLDAVRVDAHEPVGAGGRDRVAGRDDDAQHVRRDVDFVQRLVRRVVVDGEAALVGRAHAADHEHAGRGGEGANFFVVAGNQCHRIRPSPTSRGGPERPGRDACWRSAPWR